MCSLLMSCVFFVFLFEIDSHPVYNEKGQNGPASGRLEETDGG